MNVNQVKRISGMCMYATGNSQEFEIWDLKF